MFGCSVVSIRERKKTVSICSNKICIWFPVKYCSFGLHFPRSKHVAQSKNGGRKRNRGTEATSAINYRFDRHFCQFQIRRMNKNAVFFRL